MKALIFCILFSVFCASCTFYNILPSKARDKYYMEHGPDTKRMLDTFHQVKVGDHKSKVIAKWGKPLKRKSGDSVWIYHFKDIMKNKIVLEFEDDFVAQKKTTMW